MLKYLIVLLDDMSPSFCHYNNKKTERRLISYDTLKDGLVWALKENLMVQIVYPEYELPIDYLELIESVDHIDVKAASTDSDVSVFDGKNSLIELKNQTYRHVVLRLTKDDLFESIDYIEEVLKFQHSVNIVITDIESFDDESFEKYKLVLERLSTIIIDKMKDNTFVNLNLLTDRLILTAMNNCNAGDESVTLAPDGNFYLCPAFYIDGGEGVGNPSAGVKIHNAQLLKLPFAPICRECDAFQCKRCVWLNQKLTLEVNTPSHEQCVVSHLERNASQRLLEQMKKLGGTKTNKSIDEIDYLDPFDKIAR